MVKIRNFDSFGGCIPTFLPRQTCNLAWRSVGPLPRAISRLSGQRIAPAGRKTYLWTTE